MAIEKGKKMKKYIALAGLISILAMGQSFARSYTYDLQRFSKVKKYLPEDSSFVAEYEAALKEASDATETQIVLQKAISILEEERTDDLTKQWHFRTTVENAVKTGELEIRGITIHSVAGDRTSLLREVRGRSVELKYEIMEKAAAVQDIEDNNRAALCAAARKAYDKAIEKNKGRYGYEANQIERFMRSTKCR